MERRDHRNKTTHSLNTNISKSPHVNFTILNVKTEMNKHLIWNTCRLYISRSLLIESDYFYRFNTDRSSS